MESSQIKCLAFSSAYYTGPADQGARDVAPGKTGQVLCHILLSRMSLAKDRRLDTPLAVGRQATVQFGLRRNTVVSGSVKGN